MKGGTVEPQKSTDQPCEHCGLWFSSNGIHNHERNCPLKDKDVMVQPVDDVEAGVAGDTHESDPLSADAPDGEVPGTEQESPALDTSADTSSVEDEVATDGSGLGLDGPPVVDQEDVEDEPDVDESDPSTLNCPHCESDTGATPDELEEGKTYRCTDCGEEMRWSP